MKKLYFILMPIIILFSIDLILWGFIKYIDYKNDWEHRVGIWEYNDITGWYNKKNIQRKINAFEFKAFYSSDKNGFRKINIKPENDSIILFIGDSFVQGLEVNNNETFTYLLQKKSKYKIVNAGVRGFGTDQEYLLTDSLIKKIKKIKKVYVCFYINDLRENLYDNIYSQWMNKPRFIIDGDSLILEKVNRKKFANNKNEKIVKNNLGIKYNISNFIKHIFYKSSIYNIIAYKLEYTKFGLWLYKKNLMNIPEYMTYDWQIVSDNILEKGLPLYDKIIEKFSKLSDETGIDIVFIILPSEFQYQESLNKQINILKELYDFSFPIDSTYNIICKIMDKYNFEYIYPLNEFKQKDKEKTITFKMDKHLNKTGHFILSNIIVEYNNEDFNNR